jgi:radical SAM superfamily enzyme YgiQ (UPF0313 family)
MNKNDAMYSKNENTTVLLIYPPLPQNAIYSSALGGGAPHIPLGIYYIASYVRMHGFHAHCIDAEAQKLKISGVISKIKEIAPDIIGLSATTFAYQGAATLAEEIKKTFPHLPIVIGGPHATTNIENVMNNPVFDYLIYGEGEETFTELLQILKRKDTEKKEDVLSSIHGLVYRENDIVKINQPRDYIKNLDTIPFPAYDLIPDITVYHPHPTNYHFTPIANVLTSRGCPYKCTFCCRISGQKLRQRSPENVVEEIELLVNQYGVREIAFADETLTIGKQRIQNIFTLLKQKGIQIAWTCTTRVNTVDYETLAFMKKMGCWQIKFGIESGDESILKIIQKNIDLKTAREVISYCKELKIKTLGYFIIGHPGETKESIEKTIQYALDVPLDDISVMINTPMRGTVQYDEIEQYGTLSSTNTNDFNLLSPIFVPHELTSSYLIESQKKMYRKFYFRPKTLFHLITDVMSPNRIERIKSYLVQLKFIFEIEN